MAREERALAAVEALLATVLAMYSRRVHGTPVPTALPPAVLAQALQHATKASASLRGQLGAAGAGGGGMDGGGGMGGGNPLSRLGFLASSGMLKMSSAGGSSSAAGRRTGAGAAGTGSRSSAAWCHRWRTRRLWLLWLWHWRHWRPSRQYFRWSRSSSRRWASALCFSGPRDRSYRCGCSRGAQCQGRRGDSHCL